MEISQGFQEKSISIKDSVVNYKITGEGKHLLILHGWGGSSDSWVEIQSSIQKQGYYVVSIDMPGFGKSAPPPFAWGINEYADLVLAFVEKLQLKRFVLLGHSFGGQTAVKFASQHPEKIDKLILVAPSVIRRKPGLKKQIITCVAKAAGFVIPFEGLRYNLKRVLYKMLGKQDYLKAQGIMKNVFQKIILDDMSYLLSSIQARTLLIWGDKDDHVPLSDGNIMVENMPNAELHVILGAKHSPHLTHVKQVQDIIKKFL